MKSFTPAVLPTLVSSSPLSRTSYMHRGTTWPTEPFDAVGNKIRPSSPDLSYHFKPVSNSVLQAFCRTSGVSRGSLAVPQSWMRSKSDLGA